MCMNFIEVSGSIEEVHLIAEMHYLAYKEKFEVDKIAKDFNEYVAFTISDIQAHKVVCNDTYSCLIVLQDMTDQLLLNSTYHLVRRIYVKPEFRGQGLAKSLLVYCKNKYGPLLGYDGKFYMIGDKQ